MSLAKHISMALLCVVAYRSWDAQDTKACCSSRGGGRLITGLFTRSVSDNSYESVTSSHESTLQQPFLSLTVEVTFLGALTHRIGFGVHYTI